MNAHRASNNLRSRISECRDLHACPGNAGNPCLWRHVFAVTNRDLGNATIEIGKGSEWCESRVSCCRVIVEYYQNQQNRTNQDLTSARTTVIDLYQISVSIHEISLLGFQANKWVDGGLHDQATTEPLTRISQQMSARENPQWRVVVLSA